MTEGFLTLTIAPNLRDFEDRILGVLAEYFATFPDACSVEGEDGEMWIEAATGWEKVNLRTAAELIVTELVEKQGNS